MLHLHLHFWGIGSLSLAKSQSFVLLFARLQSASALYQCSELVVDSTPWLRVGGDIQWLLPSCLRTVTGLSGASELSGFSETWWQRGQNIPWHWLPYWPVRPTTDAHIDVPSQAEETHYAQFIVNKYLRIVFKKSVCVFLCKQRCFNIQQQWGSPASTRHLWNTWQIHTPPTSVTSPEWRCRWRFCLQTPTPF